MTIPTHIRWFLGGLGTFFALLLVVWGIWLTLVVQGMRVQAARGELAAQWIERNMGARPTAVAPPQAPSPSTPPSSPSPPAEDR